MPTLKITLSGPPACGKSVVGRNVAQLLKEAGHSVVFVDDRQNIDLGDFPDLELNCKGLNSKSHKLFDVVIRTKEDLT